MPTHAGGHTTDVAQPSVTEPRLRNRRVVITLAVLALSLVAWLGAAWLGRNLVQVVAAEQLLTCEGTQVVIEESIGDPEVMIPLAVVNEEMHCRLHFEVRNRGLLPVRVHSVSLPFYGPEGGAWAYAAAMEPFQAAARPAAGSPDLSDAVFVPAEPYRLRAREVAEFTVELRYRPPRCQGEGWSSVPNVPVVQVSVLGIDGDRGLAGDSFGLMCERP